MANVEKTNGQVEKTLSLIEKITAILKKTGMRDMVLGVMLLFMVVVVGKIAFDPVSVIDKIDEIRNKKHTESVLKRINSFNEINATLHSIQIETNADRVFVFETHNGGGNLANLPFLYVDLTYGLPREDFSMFNEEYKNVRLSRYPWASCLYEKYVWSSPIDDISEIDPELYHRLIKEDVDYLYAVVLYGKDTLPCGFVALIYKDRTLVQDKRDIGRVMLKYTNVLATLLTPVAP